MASRPVCNSSTATISLTVTWEPTRVQCTTRSTASLTSALRADSGSSVDVSASWQMNRNRVNAWRADPA